MNFQINGFGELIIALVACIGVDVAQDSYCQQIKHSCTIIHLKVANLNGMVYEH